MKSRVGGRLTKARLQHNVVHGSLEANNEINEIKVGDTIRRSKSGHLSQFHCYLRGFKTASIGEQ
ncbi:hypothetical protein Mapa_000786 [Marchantia paleacea]|nr:hypothetical protein Mapa_000786 [Marchantia paleacea]